MGDRDRYGIRLEAKYFGSGLSFKIFTYLLMNMEDNKIECSHCGRKFSKKGIGYHIWKMHGEGINFNPNIGYINGDRKAWNAGLNKDTDSRILQYSKVISKTIKSKIESGDWERSISEDGKRRLSEFASLNNLGGHTSKIKVYYKQLDGTEVFLQSSYELKVATELDENGIKWSRPNPLNWFNINDSKTHKYYPDFYLNDYDVYLDTKNDYLIKKDEFKINEVINQNKINLIVLDKNNLTWDCIKMQARIV